MSETTIQKFSRAAPWSLIAKIFGSVIGIITSIIIVRDLGAHDYGVLSLVNNILGFITVICAFGLGQALTRYVPELNVKHNFSGIKKLMVQVAVVQTIIWLTAFIIIYFIRGFLSDLFSADIGFYLLLGTGLIVLGIFGGIIGGVLHALYEVKILTIIGTISSIISTVLLLFLLLKFHLGIIGVMIAGPIVGGATLPILFIVFRKKIREEYLKHGDPKSGDIGTKRLFKYSIPFVASGIMNLIVWRQSEVLFLGYYSSPLEVGYYNLAYGLPQQILEFIPLAIWGLVLVSFAETYTKDPRKLQHAIELYYKMLFLLVAPLLVIGFLLSDKIILVLYGEQMMPAGSIAQTFFIIFAIGFIGTPTGMTLYTLEKTWVKTILYAIYTIMNLSLDVLLIPKYEMYGAVAAVFITLFVSAFIEIIVVKRFFKEFRIPWKFIMKCYLATTPLLIIVPFKAYIESSIELLIALSVAVMLIIIGLRVCRVIGEDEEEIISQINIPFKELILKVVRKK